MSITPNSPYDSSPKSNHFFLFLLSIDESTDSSSSEDLQNSQSLLFVNWFLSAFSIPIFY